MTDETTRELRARAKKAERAIFKVRAALIKAIVYGISAEERYGKAGAHTELTRKAMAMQLWKLLPKADLTLTASPR